MIAITKQHWGELASGEQIELYTLRNSKGVQVQITTYGGRLVAVKTPDRQGKLGDIALGFDHLAGYVAKNPYFGALVGRYANRIANGEFTLNGANFKLARNNGENSLHGGLVGFDKKRWDAREIESGIELRYVSEDGEEGYPGTLTVTARYTLSDANELKIEYHAETDADTVLNLTNHSYFDLSGEGAGKIVGYEVTIYADRFTPVNSHLIPTGELRPVEGTPFDFRESTVIGKRIDEKDEQLGYGAGYDHNYVLNSAGSLSPAAKAFDPVSGRVLEVLTTEPGMQFYTGNHLDGSATGKHGHRYTFRTGFCFETQHFPDSPNQPAFPSTTLKKGQTFTSTTVFRFSTM